MSVIEWLNLHTCKIFYLDKRQGILLLAGKPLTFELIEEKLHNTMNRWVMNALQRGIIIVRPPSLSFLFFKSHIISIRNFDSFKYTYKILFLYNFLS